jgi:hypothetical protein
MGWHNATISALSAATLGITDRYVNENPESKERNYLPQTIRLWFYFIFTYEIH